MDDAVWFRALDQTIGTWQPWQSLCGGVTSVPRRRVDARRLRRSVRREVPDGAVWMRTSFDLMTWSHGNRGFLLGDPAVATYTPWITEDGEADVVVIGWGGDFQPGPFVRRDDRGVRRLASHLTDARHRTCMGRRRHLVGVRVRPSDAASPGSANRERIDSTLG